MYLAELHQSTSTGSKVGDAAALGITIGAFFGFLPQIAALLSVIWLILQITRFTLDWYRSEKRRKGQRRRRGDRYGEDAA